MTIPINWRGSYLNEDGDLMVVWGTTTDDDIQPGQSLGGYSISAKSIPGIVPYYAEGWVPSPDSIAEDHEQDSIYHHLTPYGPGVVGKTVGPVLPPNPFVSTVFLDTLLSYTRLSAELGWLGRGRDDDCDNDEKPEDGIVRNIEQRLKKAKKELQRRDSVLARRELEKLVSKVERLWKRSQEEDKKDKRDRREKRDKVVMTSEAYALLKFNTEYLIDRLPDRKPKKSSKDKD